MFNLQIWHAVLTAVILLLLGGYIGARIAILANLVRISQGREHQVTILLDQVAAEMASHPVAQWPEWCVHLLRSLENKAQGGAYEKSLHLLRDRIADRLETKRW